MRRHPFDYAVIRVVPRVERGEFINAGVLLYSRELDFLGASVQLDRARLRALDPAADVGAIGSALRAVAELCVPGDVGSARGSETAAAADAAGPAAEQIGRRFRWLTAPRSTVVQAGPIHTGLTADPAAELDRLMRLLVHAPN